MAEALTHVYRNMVSKIEGCIQDNGRHLQHVLLTLVYVLCSVLCKTQCSVFGYGFKWVTPYVLVQRTQIRS
jgi:hypothetical protein